ncbi:MAG: right-handed parallel beta-helix repeat-containing protein [Candidatus Lokiarchaeota archaeon]|nr:right-handed parallel beta-helix repeat-containing protein [Candidatus Lokiarchaeota archaeon]
MYKKKIIEGKKSTALIISIILLFIFSFKFNNLTTEGNNVDNNTLKISALTSPIFIDDTVPGSNWTWATGESWFGGGSGTSCCPYILEDLIIDGGGTDDCITILNSNKDFIIRNCTVYNGDGPNHAGIVLNNVTNGQILQNNCTMNDWFGIYFEDCKNNIISDNSVSLNPSPGIIGYNSNYTTISDNTVSDSSHGIYLDTCLNNDILDNVVYDTTMGYGIDLEDSPHNKIESNEIRSCMGGIEINNTFSGAGNANENTVVDNILEDNENSGILLQGNFTEISGNTCRNNSIHGIYLYEFSYHNIITNNILDNNSMVGIYLLNSSDNQIFSNEISDNGLAGAALSPDSDENLFSENFFLKNKKHAYDYGANNDWNSLTIGNYWDNYTGTDANYDGIGDTPHNITGDSGSKDYLPIWDEGIPLINITSPLNNSNVGRDAPDFTVKITEPNLDTMWYTIDGGINNITSTLNGTIDQTSWETLWDSLVKGDTITIMFYANDTFGHLGSNYIVLIKHVSADGIGLDFFTTSMLILITSGIAIIAIISKIHSKKRIISH